MRHSYVRFVTDRIDWYSSRRQGLFYASYDLINSNVLFAHELEELQSVRAWFGRHLAVPERFARSRKSRAAPKAICWFKSSATQYVTRMHPIRRILTEHGIHTQMITCARPGYIVFEDDHQIAAEPFAETIT